MRPVLAAEEAGAGEAAISGLAFTPDAMNIDEARRVSRNAIVGAAYEHGIEPSEIEAVIRERLSHDLKNPISIRRGVRGTLSVLEEGRFKTQFETGTSGGAFAPRLRSEAERDGLGVPVNISPNGRPVYGYVRTESHGADMYGVVEFELRSDVKGRSTITFGDSLMRFRRGSYGQVLVGTPLENPGIEAWDDEVESYYRGGAGAIGYIEAQIQGGVTLSDVQRVILHGRANSIGLGPIVEELDRLGIQWVEDLTGR